MTEALAPGTIESLIPMVDPNVRAWEPKGRPALEPHQEPPAGFPSVEKTLWLLEAGRGAGKTEACARYYTSYMRRHPGHRGRIIAPTYGDAVEACITGPSGLLSVDPEIRWVPSDPGGSKVKWPNGSEAIVFGTATPKEVERFRAYGNRHIDWWEEMAANPQLKDSWDQAAFGLRLGDHPHAIASTTPRSTKAYKAIRKMEQAVLVKASMFDNPYNPPGWVEMMRKKYQGTRLGRQELAGELLEDVEGALWSREQIEMARVYEYPDLAIVATAVDPAATSKPDSDDTGIIAGGVAIDGDVYILHDRTCHLTPAKWGARIVSIHDELRGDYVVGETNNGGEMVEHVIKTVDKSVPFRAVHASRGKATRAQPVASLFGQVADEEEGIEERDPRVHLVGSFPELEDQLCTWVPGDEDSPDRLDALVWLVTDLLLTEDEEQDVVEHYEPVRIGADI